MDSQYSLIRNDDHAYALRLITHAIELCSDPVSTSQLEEGSDATASYPGAYGYCYQTLKQLKEQLQFIQSYDPKVPF